MSALALNNSDSETVDEGAALAKRIRSDAPVQQLLREAKPSARIARPLDDLAGTLAAFPALVDARARAGARADRQAKFLAAVQRFAGEVEEFEESNSCQMDTCNGAIRRVIHERFLMQAETYEQGETWRERDRVIGDHVPEVRLCDYLESIAGQLRDGHFGGALDVPPMIATATGRWPNDRRLAVNLVRNTLETLGCQPGPSFNKLGLRCAGLLLGEDISMRDFTAAAS